MTGMETRWKDVTRYERGQKVIRQPRAWERTVGDLIISVRWSVDLKRWHGMCRTLGVERHPLVATDGAVARLEFLAYLHNRTRRATAVLDVLLGEEARQMGPGRSG